MNRKHVLVAIIVVAAVVVAGASAAVWWWGFPSDDGGGVAVAFSTDAGEVVFQCEEADSPAKWSEGLSGRENLGDGNGMVFFFPYIAPQTFWMKGCLIPLDIIFVWENGTIGAIYEAPIEPGVADGDLTRYESPGPVKWVVELNLGACEANGIVAGHHVDFINVEA